MILNTHSHADHIGGNKYLYDNTGCKIYAPDIECDFTKHTVLESAFLFGAYPTDELRHKFLFAQPSEAMPLTDEVLPHGIEAISLKGHSFDMVGYRTSDGVVYLADCLSSVQTLDKYKIVFLYDIKAYIETLKDVSRMQAKLFIPSHTAPSEDIFALADYNIEKTYQVAEDILAICKEPKNFELILKTLFNKYEIQMTFEQYALVGSTVRSYLSWLKSEGKITAACNNGALLWQSK